MTADDALTFLAVSDVVVTETTIPSGDWSWRWDERRGFVTVPVEVAWVHGRRRWLRWFGARSHQSTYDLDWPAPADREQARETVRTRAGSC